MDDLVVVLVIAAVLLLPAKRQTIIQQPGYKPAATTAPATAPRRKQ